jgi:cytochrome c-type biogenesis protein CcmH/NrfG
MAQDFYEILQVHPRADSEAIRAAYERLIGMYDPARLEGAAEELIVLARRKREAIEAAYTTLSHHELRAAYDQELAARPVVAPGGAVQPGDLAEKPDLQATEPGLDYRPLPPANRTERPRTFVHEPALSRPVGPRTNLAVAGGIIAITLVAIIGVSLLITNWATVAQPLQPTAVPTPTSSVLADIDANIAQARQATVQSPNDPEVWIQLGNHLYDSVQIVRENMPSSTLYQERLPRWLEASQAYERALALQPENAGVLADKGVSLCYYGVGVGDQSFVAKGIDDTRTAAQQRPEDPLIQLNLGNCLVSAQPPQTDAAVLAWQRVVQVAPADSVLAQRANELIQEYQPR